MTGVSESSQQSSNLKDEGYISSTIDAAVVAVSKSCNFNRLILTTNLPK
ncbi:MULTISPECIES: hypothetical protein [Photorhabdus]|nr:hypothetical protein [Photorhabdus asymbiotica]